MSSGIVSGGVVVTGISGGGGVSCVTQPALPAVGMVQWNNVSQELNIFNGMTWERVATQPPQEVLRTKYPTLQQAWDHYQIILKMCEAQERLEE